jgi:hypothetical protein
MSFTHFTFEKLLGFLKLLTELDLAWMHYSSIQMVWPGSRSYFATARLFAPGPMGR